MKRKPVTNTEVGRALRELSLLYEMDDVPFKPRALEKASYAVEASPTPVSEILAEGGVKALTRIPSVGEGIAERIEELVHDGRITDLEKLRKKYPVDVLALTAIEGVGPKTVRTLHETLGIESVDELAEAVEAGRLREVPHFGAKSEEKLKKGLELARAAAGRLPIGSVLDLARSIETRLAEVKGAERVAIAGSLRRRRETVGDMDILVAARDPEAVADAFTALPEVVHVHARGPTKTSVRLDRGLDADLRVVPRESFGAALQYFTGSKAHNVALRKIAQKRKLKLSEYGLFRGEKNLASRTEAEIYEALGLDFVPPELREDRGEIEAAAAHRLPRLVEANDLRGDLQVHTSRTDGTATVEEMARAAMALGREYLVITDHTRDLPMTGGLDEAGLRKQIAEVRKVDAKLEGIRVLAGAEVNIRADGSLDVDDEVLAELDLVGVAIHSRFDQPREEMTRRVLAAIAHPNVHMLIHPLGRALGKRRPVDLDADKLIAAAKAHGTILEIDAQPERLDLPDELVRKAVEAGVKIAIDSDAHSPAELRYPEDFGVAVARRGWAEAKDVVNAWPLAKVLAAIGKKGKPKKRTHKPRGEARH